MTNLLGILLKYELCGLAFTVLNAIIFMVFVFQHYSEDVTDQLVDSNNWEVNPNWKMDVAIYLLIWPVVVGYRLLGLLHQIEDAIHS